MMNIIIIDGLISFLAVIIMAILALIFKKSRKNTVEPDLESGEKTSPKIEEDSDDDDYIDPNYRVPYSTDSEPEFEEYVESIQTTVTQLSSEYDSEAEENERWEQFKISVAPRGPVPDDQVLLVITCPEDKLYRKAVTNEQRTHIEIGVYSNILGDTWQWMPSRCDGCIEECRRRLEGCGLPIISAKDFDDQIEKWEDSGDEADVEDSDDEYYHYY